MTAVLYSIFSFVVYGIILIVSTIILVGAILCLLSEISSALRLKARIRQTQVVVTKPEIKKSRTAARPDLEYVSNL